MINKGAADHFESLIVLSDLHTSRIFRTAKDWLASSTREMIRIQRVKTQCTERDKPARKTFTEVSQKLLSMAGRKWEATNGV